MAKMCKNVNNILKIIFEFFITNAKIKLKEVIIHNHSVI